MSISFCYSLFDICFHQFIRMGALLFNLFTLTFSPSLPPRALIAGGGAPEIELALRLAEYSRTLPGMEAYCVRAYADALEVVPSTLAENAGLNPISTVTELRNRHAQGEKTAGINVRKVRPCHALLDSVWFYTSPCHSWFSGCNVEHSDLEQM